MIENDGIFFPDVKPSFCPPKPPLAPHPKPMFTVQEEFLQTTARVNEALSRVLRMEEGLKATLDEYMRTLTADNVTFKDVCIATYNQFAQRVTNEINTFEGEITNSYNAFAESVKGDISGYVAAVNAFETSVNERIVAFETAQTEALTAYKGELNEMLNSFRDTTNARIDQYNALSLIHI